MKNILIQGVVAGILAAIASLTYHYLYQSTLGADFDAVLSKVAIISSSLIGCLLIAAGYLILFKFNKEKFNGILNIIIVILSFASIFGPILMTLPLDIEAPELFPGLVIPMHFFPALAYFAIEPFFRPTKNIPPDTVA